MAPSLTLNVNTPDDLDHARRRDAGRRAQRQPLTMTGLPGEYADALSRAAEAGIRLDDDEVDAVLALARTVAHATERRFAPLASYLAGKYVMARTRSGVPEAEALAEAVAIMDELLPPPTS